MSEGKPVAEPDGLPAWARRRRRLHALYFGAGPGAVRFQVTMLVLDIGLISFFMVAPFLERGAMFLVLDYCIAGVLGLDLAARGWAFGDLRRWARRPLVWADLAVFISLALPVYTANLGFLRILRAYSLVHGELFWRVIGGGRWMNSQVVESTKAATNLGVFIFVMTGLVHSAFAARVPTLRSYMDSLYFTVSTLTTTGYGDIVLPGAGGRALSILIMIGGVSLFFRLVQVTIRTSKVRHECPSCGLQRHETDAVHCKGCGALLKISHENE
ncbi:MAG: ion channel [Gammaproteobacteria bacterium]